MGVALTSAGVVGHPGYSLLRNGKRQQEQAERPRRNERTGIPASGRRADAGARETDAQTVRRGALGATRGIKTPLSGAHGPVGDQRCERQVSHGVVACAND
ncbi:hypothetical protein GCM10010245_49340 [Streptomyces spectabilis]|nr:hypothetical protein GCM10010245_49340 [Streptomyces spectabilis]